MTTWFTQAKQRPYWVEILGKLQFGWMDFLKLLEIEACGKQSEQIHLSSTYKYELRLKELWLHNNSLAPTPLVSSPPRKLCFSSLQQGWQPRGIFNGIVPLILASLRLGCYSRNRLLLGPATILLLYIPPLPPHR